MSNNLNEKFYWFDFQGFDNMNLSAKEKYDKIVEWAGRARGVNPTVFDEVTSWMLDDSNWTKESMNENEIIFKSLIEEFKEQNKNLLLLLEQLKVSGVVNEAVFPAIDRFNKELSGDVFNKDNKKILKDIFQDFSKLLDKEIREKIAGNLTGPHGTNTVSFFGYINTLKDLDAGVQWTLFMPDLVKQQMNGFHLVSFECKRMPAFRFIGKLHTIEEKERKELFSTLEHMKENHIEFNYDIFLEHHNGGGVDTSPWNGYWGRFMKEGTPIPKGYVGFDFVPYDNERAGLPYLSQFAFALYEGDVEAMHKNEGYDVHGLYDVTRNIILGQGIHIPYPDKYWTAGVHLDGYEKDSTAYLFSIHL